MNGQREKEEITIDILEVSDLYVAFPTSEGAVKAVNTIDLTIAGGEVFGVLGESGSGKSVFGSTILHLIKDKVVIHGEILYKGQDLLHIKKKALQAMRGKEVGVIMQNPSSSLNPTMRVGTQIGEAWIIVNKVDRKKGRKKKFFFGGIRRQPVIMGMRSFGVIETVDVLEQTKIQVIKRRICFTVDFFLFQVLEKALHNSVIIRMPFRRKGLNHIQIV